MRLADFIYFLCVFGCPCVSLSAELNLKDEVYGRATALTAEQAYNLVLCADNVIGDLSKPNTLPHDFWSLVEQNAVEIAGLQGWAGISAAFKFVNPISFIAPNKAFPEEILVAISKNSFRASYSNGDLNDPICYVIWWMPDLKRFRHAPHALNSMELDPLIDQLRKQNAYPEVLTLSYEASSSSRLIPSENNRGVGRERAEINYSSESANGMIGGSNFTMNSGLLILIYFVLIVVVVFAFKLGLSKWRNGKK